MPLSDTVTTGINAKGGQVDIPSSAVSDGFLEAMLEQKGRSGVVSLLPPETAIPGEGYAYV